MLMNLKLIYNLNLDLWLVVVPSSDASTTHMICYNSEAILSII